MSEAISAVRVHAKLQQRGSAQKGGFVLREVSAFPDFFRGLLMLLFTFLRM